MRRRIRGQPSNDELITKLFEEGDRVRRSLVDEIVQRSGELLPELAAITMDRMVWTAELPAWWAPVHTTYILGVIGGQEVITPLLSSLRWSDAYDHEWVTEDLPAIFGRMGGIAIEPLLAVAADKSAGWSARSIAIDSLAAIAVVFPEYESRLLRFIEAQLKHRDEHPGVRRAAAVVLLDLRMTTARDPLVAFAKEEEKRASEYEEYHAAYSQADVDRELAVMARAEDYYRRDWLLFYNDDEIRRRQLAWQQEDQAFSRARFGGGGGSEREAASEGLRLCPCGSGKMYRHCCWGKLH